MFLVIRLVSGCKVTSLYCSEFVLLFYIIVVNLQSYKLKQLFMEDTAIPYELPEAEPRS